LARDLLPNEALHLLGDMVRLHLSENTGAFLGLGAALPPNLRFWIFTVAAGLMLAGIALYTATSPELPADGVIALACVIGGGVSNLIDRVVHNGRVTDFLNFGIGNLRTGILNVADIAITFGAIYAVWATARYEEAADQMSGKVNERISDNADRRVSGETGEQGQRHDVGSK
jgi:signal peptidase II